MSDRGERAVVSDDGDRILLMIYAMHSARTLAEVEMAPMIALRLANELTRAACLHLTRHNVQ